jgi:hypothetical protein
MAREQTTTGQVDKNGVPHVRLHLGTLSNVLMPQLDHWLNVAQSNTSDDVGAYLRGIESRSVVQKRYDEKRTQAVAKKKPTVKKKV